MSLITEDTLGDISITFDLQLYLLVKSPKGSLSCVHLGRIEMGDSIAVIAFDAASNPDKGSPSLVSASAKR